MNGYFFNVFKNHFLKIHRSVLHKITIDILYFEMFMTSVYGEKYGRSICLARQKQYFLLRISRQKQSLGGVSQKIVVLQCNFFVLVKS